MTALPTDAVAIIAVLAPSIKSIAKFLPNCSTDPPASSIDPFNLPVSKVTRVSIAGARPAASCCVTPLKSVFSLVNESTASSTPSAASEDMTIPNA